jgi:hypothetical protein
LSTSTALQQLPSQGIRLLLIEDGRERSFALGSGDCLIGRSENAKIRASNLDVSAKHAMLKIDGARISVRDLGSTNGTFIAGRRISAHQDFELPAGNIELKLGQAVTLRILREDGTELDLPPPPQAERSMLLRPSASETPPFVAATQPVELDLPGPATAAPASRDPRPDTLVDRARKRAMAEIETIQSEAVQFAESIKEEARRESARIKDELRQETSVLQAAIAEYRAEREKLKTDCQDLQSEQETIRHALERIRLEHADLEREREQLRSENQALDAELKTQDERSAAMRKEYAQLTHDKRALEGVRAELASTQATLDAEKAELDDQREKAARERVVWEAEERRRKALEGATEAELNIKRLAAEAKLGEIELKRLEAERELQRLVNRQQEAERAAERARADAERDSEKLRADAAHAAEKLRSDTDREIEKLRAETARETERLRSEAAQEAEKTRADAQHDAAEAAKRSADADNHATLAHERVQALEHEALELRKKCDRLKHDADLQQDAIQEQEGVLAALKRKTDECAKGTEAAQGELEEARKRIVSESDALRLAADIELQALRKAADDEIVALRKSAQDELAREAELKRSQLTQEFADKGKAMQRELADAKMRELKIIQLMQDEERRAAQMRLDSTHDEIVTRTLGLAKQKPLEEAQDELRSLVRAALEGKTTASLSVEANERTRLFWKKVALRASIPAGIILFFVLFPGVPGAIKERFDRTVASEKDEAGVFLDQIRLRGMKYQPETNREYRATYSDNLVYLEEYAIMKLSDAEQKEWTLLLNDFIVGRLGLSDRVIPDFISEESVMVRELMRIREGIVPQFKDQGFARMAEAENLGREKLERLLQGAENYAKFRAFERSFYDGFMQRHKGAKGN